MHALINPFRERPYSILLATLLLMVIVYPIVHEFAAIGLLFDVIVTMVFLATFQFVFKQTVLRIPGILFGTPTLIGVWADNFTPGNWQHALLIGYHCAAAGFFLLAVIAILRNIYRASTLTLDSIFGAFCGYLLLGVAFGDIYCAIETTRPGSITGDERLVRCAEDPDLCHFTLTYFSLLTLTTVGYGDIRPVAAAARSLAAVEAVIGQFYIAVLIAELIGKRASQSAARPSRD